MKRKRTNFIHLDIDFSSVIMKSKKIKFILTLHNLLKMYRIIYHNWKTNITGTSKKNNYFFSSNRYETKSNDENS